MSEYYSRRIDTKNRIVYQIANETIYFSSAAHTTKTSNFHIFILFYLKICYNSLSIL
ncbi:MULTISPECIES: type II toxin-antitoxin system YoeB family toxin [Campylobacter]|uniref:type II toxin-antitoxin system YoeB family toxin n=1 Tax=Campylobacter TaxID=194 RepID=UPI001FD4FD1C|nr:MULTISPECIES: type II toxin-antitoxin system YoeB family toxin [Campylobacter]